MRRKQTTPKQASSTTDDAVLQKINLLSHIIDNTGLIATVSYNLHTGYLYVQFAPDFLVSMRELSQVLATATRLKLSNPIISFRDNLIRFGL